MTTRNYSCIINVINTTDMVDIQTPHVEITPLKAETETQLHNTEISKETSKSMFHTEKIKSSLRIKHLNKEEKKAIIEICERYSDMFYIEGEPQT